MTGACIHEGDIPIVDRAIKPVHNDVVIVALGDPGFAVKRLHSDASGRILLAEHHDYQPINLATFPDGEIWGGCQVQRAPSQSNGCAPAHKGDALNTVLAKVDCRNFYLNSVGVWNQAIHTKPVLVLGNNDYTVVALSDEARILGIHRGMPVFECRELIKKHQIMCFSSN